MSGQSENFALAEPRLDQVLSKFSVCPQLHSWGTAVSCKCDFQKKLCSHVSDTWLLQHLKQVAAYVGQLGEVTVV